MRILIITPFYPIDGRPDLQYDTSAVHYFVKYWTGAHEVKVFNVYPHSYKDICRYTDRKKREYYRKGYVFSKDGAEVYIAEVQKFPGQKGNYFAPQKKHILSQFRRWMGSNGFIPDVIIAHVPSYAYTFIEELTASIGRKIPVLGILHNTDIETLCGNSALKSALERCFISIYARSYGIRRKAAAFGLQNLRDEIIHSGIPLMDSTVDCVPYKADPLRIVFAGKLIPLKNVDAVIYAVSRLNRENIRLDIIGSGTEERRLRTLVKELGLEEKVFFLGTMSRYGVIEHMRKANLYCMPSFPETLGLTYLEAMSVGCVPIGTKGEGIDGIIRDGWNGYLVDTSNLIDSVVEKLQTYEMLNADERKILSERARISVRGMDEQTCADKYLDLIQREIFR